MPLHLTDLDGKYRVSTISDYQGVMPLKSDGITEIKNGKTDRTDSTGCKWTTELSIISDTEVKLISIADPSGASNEFLLTREDGSLTHDPVTYTTILKVSKKETKIRLSGNIQHGKTLTTITMTKID